MDETPISNPFDNEDQGINQSPIDNEDTGGRRLVWALLGVIVLGCCLFFVAAFVYFQPDTKSLYAEYFPSPTSTPTRTPTSTPTPNLTATARAVQATETVLAFQSTAESAATNWEVIRSDTFDSNENDWLLEKESDDEYALRTREIVGGKYIWDTTAHNSFISWVRVGRRALTDFYLSVDIDQIEGPKTTDYGLSFREDVASNFYYFAINERGQYSLFLYNNDWETLVNWTETDLIKQDGVNRLTVIAEGSHFAFFINGQYLAELTDDSIPSGSTGLVVEMHSKDDHAIFEFDNFELRVP